MSTDNLLPLPDPPVGALTSGEIALLRSWADKYAAAAVAAERERCAQIADHHARRNYPLGSENTDRYHAQADWAARIAAVIRQEVPR